VSPDASALEQLIARAEASALSPTTNKRNKQLLMDMAVAIVGLAKANTVLAQQMAEKPRIVLP
jgi:hypothetical protein